jgi:hypothetical protein
MKTNKLGLRDLFHEKETVIKAFIDYVKIDKSLCQSDVDDIQIQLMFNALNVNHEYIHFSRANILDFLQMFDIYVSNEFQDNFEYKSSVYCKDDDKFSLIWTMDNTEYRVRSMELGIQSALTYLNGKLDG